MGETFTLGNASWRIETIDPHRVVVSRAPGQTAVMPFWRGENAARSSELGEAIGLLSREVSERLDDRDLQSWLVAECRLTPDAARALREHLARQKRLTGMVPDDRTILVETFVDPSGELSLAVLTPLGGRLHHALKLALTGVIRQRLGLSPACLHSNDGLLFRLPMLDEPPLDLFDGLTGEVAERFIREELPETSLFGLRFRQNAARALLLPRPDPSKRTPLWLQRLRRKGPAPDRTTDPRFSDRARDGARVPGRRSRSSAIARAAGCDPVGRGIGSQAPRARSRRRSLRS